MTDSFFLDLARSDDDYFYADSVTRRTVQWPLALSWYAASGSTDPNVLLNDNPAEYLVYSGGVHSTSVMLNRLERIGGISLNVVSGSYVSVGVIVGETLNDPVPNFYGWPATTSGTALRTELYFPTKYENLPPAPSELLVPLAGSGQFNIVFPEPVFNRSFTVVHSGLGEYAISQILPRRATGAFDLEVNAIKAYHVSADLIDTIALQVSESIVVSPDIPDKSITGAKILDGTISGVIITPGTITSNEIAAGTITGNKIAANTISGALMTAGTITFDKIASKTLTSEQIADASITGANIVAGTVSGVLITDSAITASKIAAGTITGDKIAANTISGVLITAGTITSDKLQVNQLDAIAANMGSLIINSGVTIGNNGNLYVGSGKFTTLNASGLAFKNPVSEASNSVFPAGSDFSISRVQQYAPDVNSIKFAPYYYNATSGTLQLFDYEPPRYTTIIGQRQYYEPGLTLDDVGNYSTFSIDSGWLPSESGRAYYVPSAKNNVYITSKSAGLSTLSLSTQTVNASGSITMNGNQITISGTGSARSLNLATPTKVTSADFSVLRLTPSFPGFPPLETYLFTVTSGQAIFDVPVVFNQGVTTAGYSPFFGDGSDGAIVFDGSTASVNTNYCTYLFPAYTLTRDIYASSLTVASGVVIETNGFRIFCLNTLTNNGVIRNNGQSGVSGVATGAAGGAGNFFKAGGAGATGYGTATAGAVGLAPPTQTNTVGGIGGRGAAAHSSVVSQETSPITAIAMQPAAAVGGHKLISNITSFMQPYLPLGTSNAQFTPSIGGGSGSKSGTGSGARSGAGGGGGGVVFVAASKIVNSGVIQANGGDGGPASGAGVNLGGGGGGGGGIVGLVYSRNATGLSSIPNCEAKPGVGGNSVATTNPSRAVIVNRENVLLSGTKYTTGTILNKNSTYFLVFHTVGGYVYNIDHPNMLSWDITAQAYGFATAASPTRYLQVFQLYYVNGTSNIQDYQELNISFSAGVTSCRMVIDEVQNLGDPALWYMQGYNDNSVDSGTSLAIDLGYVPNANNVVYTAYARSGGTSPTAGTGNTTILSTTAAPAIFTMASLGRQINNHGWTGASAAAGLSLDLGTHDLYSPTAELSERGATGWHGRVIQFWV